MLTKGDLMTPEERLKEEIEDIILTHIKRKISKKKLDALVNDCYRTFTGENLGKI
jgi:hypothetical protein